MSSEGMQWYEYVNHDIKIFVPLAIPAYNYDRLAVRISILLYVKISRWRHNLLIIFLSLSTYNVLSSAHAHLYSI